VAEQRGAVHLLHYGISTRFDLALRRGDRKERGAQR